MDVTVTVPGPDVPATTLTELGYRIMTGTSMGKQISINFLLLSIAHSTDILPEQLAPWSLVSSRSSVRPAAP